MNLNISEHDRWKNICLKVLRSVLALSVIQFGLISLLPFPLYFPPTFSLGFLVGRESYFYSHYAWCFYSHIISAPIVFFMGLLQFSSFVRIHRPNWHRIIGRAYIAMVILLVVPSGLGMAFYAKGGIVAKTGFMALAVLTGSFTVQGWRAILHRDFAGHTIWMWRSYLMICSAPFLRFLAMTYYYLSIPASFGYPFAAWASWLIPLVVYEIFHRSTSGMHRDADNRRFLPIGGVDSR